VPTREHRQTRIVSRLWRASSLAQLRFGRYPIHWSHNSVCAYLPRQPHSPDPCFPSALVPPETAQPWRSSKSQTESENTAEVKRR
jgi:hypothetical protein